MKSTSPDRRVDGTKVGGPTNRHVGELSDSSLSEYFNVVSRQILTIPLNNKHYFNRREALEKARGKAVNEEGKRLVLENKFLQS